jgi:hypothetical protein
VQTDHLQSAFYNKCNVCLSWIYYSKELITKRGNTPIYHVEIPTLPTFEILIQSQSKSTNVVKVQLADPKLASNLTNATQFCKLKIYE